MVNNPNVTHGALKAKDNIGEILKILERDTEEEKGSFLAGNTAFSDTALISHFYANSKVLKILGENYNGKNTHVLTAYHHFYNDLKKSQEDTYETQMFLGELRSAARTANNLDIMGDISKIEDLQRSKIISAAKADEKSSNSQDASHYEQYDQKPVDATQAEKFYCDTLCRHYTILSSFLKAYDLPLASRIDTEWLIDTATRNTANDIMYIQRRLHQVENLENTLDADPEYDLEIGREKSVEGAHRAISLLCALYKDEECTARKDLTEAAKKAVELRNYIKYTLGTALSLSALVSTYTPMIYRNTVASGVQVRIQNILKKVSEFTEKYPAQSKKYFPHSDAFVDTARILQEALSAYSDSRELKTDIDYRLKEGTWNKLSVLESLQFTQLAHTASVLLSEKQAVQNGLSQVIDGHEQILRDFCNLEYGVSVIEADRIGSALYSLRFGLGKVNFSGFSSPLVRKLFTRAVESVDRTTDRLSNFVSTEQLHWTPSSSSLQLLPGETAWFSGNKDVEGTTRKSSIDSQIETGSTVGKTQSVFSRIASFLGMVANRIMSAVRNAFSALVHYFRDLRNPSLSKKQAEKKTAEQVDAETLLDSDPFVMRIVERRNAVKASKEVLSGSEEAKEGPAAKGEATEGEVKEIVRKVESVPESEKTSPIMDRILNNRAAVKEAKGVLSNDEASSSSLEVAATKGEATRGGVKAIVRKVESVPESERTSPIMDRILNNRAAVKEAKGVLSNDEVSSSSVEEREAVIKETASEVALHSESERASHVAEAGKSEATQGDENVALKLKDEEETTTTSTRGKGKKETKSFSLSSKDSTQKHMSPLEKLSAERMRSLSNNEGNGNRGI